MFNKNKKFRNKVFVAGHNGMVGKAIVRALSNQDSVEIITRSKNELDLTNQNQVENFLKEQEIEQVYIAAAKVGGIYANDKFPAEFIYNNLMIESNLIHFSFLSGIKKLLFLGSSCIYPKLALQPMKEECLLSGYLEPSNEPYAVAKIAGIKLCESYNRQYSEEFNIDYRSVMPTNLYGPGDNYHPKNSHVIPALIQRFHKSKITGESTVQIWGTGNPKREFLHVDDLASACIHIMNLNKEDYLRYTEPMCSHINIGSGLEIQIKDLAELIKSVTGFKGDIVYDSSMPDGSPRKLLDIERIKSLGWSPKIKLLDGLREVYKDYQQNHN